MTRNKNLRRDILKRRRHRRLIFIQVSAPYSDRLKNCALLFAVEFRRATVTEHLCLPARFHESAPDWPAAAAAANDRSGRDGDVAFKAPYALSCTRGRHAMRLTAVLRLTGSFARSRVLASTKTLAVAFDARRWTAFYVVPRKSVRACVLLLCVHDVYRVVSLLGETTRSPFPHPNDGWRLDTAVAVRTCCRWSNAEEDR